MALVKTCVVCGKASCEGIDIGGEHICAECEANMVQAEAGTLEYEVLLSRLGALSLPDEPLTAEEAEQLEAELNQYEPMTVDELLARSGLEPQCMPDSGAAAGESAGRVRQRADVAHGAQGGEE